MNVARSIVADILVAIALTIIFATVALFIPLALWLKPEQEKPNHVL